MHAWPAFLTWKCDWLSNWLTDSYDTDHRMPQPIGILSIYISLCGRVWFCLCICGKEEISYYATFRIRFKTEHIVCGWMGGRMDEWMDLCAISLCRHHFVCSVFLSLCRSVNFKCYTLNDIVLTIAVHKKITNVCTHVCVCVATIALFVLALVMFITFDISIHFTRTLIRKATNQPTNKYSSVCVYVGWTKYV